MENGKNCYNCVFRGNVSGSAHSSCNVIKNIVEDQAEAKMVELLIASKSLMLGFKDRTTQETTHIVELNPHGVKNGWASWPLDFDPIWVEKCQCFRDKAEIKAEVEK